MPATANRILSGLPSDVIEEYLGRQRMAFRWWPRLFGWEWRLLCSFQGLVFAVSIFNYMLTFLAGASKASVGIQGLSHGIILGMASAVQTVCGHAYGAKKYAAMGVICQRAMRVHSGAAVILTFVCRYSGPAPRAMGQSESIAEKGQIFSRGSIPQIYAFALKIVNPLAYMVVRVFLLYILLTWIDVYVFKLSLLGLLVASSHHQWLSIKALTGIWTYIKLIVASTVMLCLEIWYNQGLAPISGLLPNPTILLDSVSVRYFHPSLILQHLHFTDSKLLILTWWWFINFIMNYLNWDINVMLGLSAAASNELGAAHPKAAKFSVLVVNANSIFVSVVVQAVSNLIPSLAISVFLNGIQPILSGVAIGSGWQAIVAYVNLACYHIMGLPMGCLLGFKTSLD
ncbi:hypothetical protein CICLE_v10017656mg, partial [Citrus x clementina]